MADHRPVAVSVSQVRGAGSKLEFLVLLTLKDETSVRLYRKWKDIRKLSTAHDSLAWIAEERPASSDEAQRER